MAEPHFITAEEEYRKDEQLKEEDVIKLREWLQTQSNLPHDLSDEKLLMYIHCSEYDIERAKNVIEKDFSLRNKYPEMFADLDPCSEEQENIWKLVEFWVSREVTDEGYRICYAGLHNHDPKKYNFLEAMKAAIMVMKSDYSERGTCPGFVFVLNAKGTSFGHVLKASLTYIRAFLTFAQEANPIKMKAVHIINVSYIVDKLMILTKPFIGKTLYDLIHLHSEMQTFLHIMDEKVLPNELGGTAGTLEEIRNSAKLRIKSYREFFLKEKELVKSNLKKSNSPRSSIHALDVTNN